MRKILFLLLLISGVAKAQWTPQTAWGYQFKRIKVDSSMLLPTDTVRNKAGIAQIGSNLFLYNGYWRLVGGSTIDTTRYVKYSDSTVRYVTPTQLIPYLQTGTDISVKSVTVTGTNGGGHVHLRHQASDPTSTGQSSALFAASDGRLKYKNDGLAVDNIAIIRDTATTLATKTDIAGLATTSSVNSALGLKLNIGDTSTMLGGYLRKADTIRYASALNSKLNISDTAAMLANYVRRSTGTYAQRLALTPTTGQQFYQTDIFSGLYEYNGRIWQRNRTGVINDCDFLNANDLAMNGLATSTSGTGASINYGATTGTAQNTTGIVALGTGTTTTGYARCMYSILNTGGFTSYGGNAASTYIRSFRVLFPTLADGTESYNARFGDDNTVNSSTNNAGFSFFYNNTNANWQLQYINASSVYTTAISSVAVAANTWYELSIVAYGTTVEFYINNTLAGSYSTIGSMAISPIFSGIYKTAGTTSRSVWVDFMKFYQLK